MATFREVCVQQRRSEKRWDEGQPVRVVHLLGTTPCNYTLRSVYLSAITCEVEAAAPLLEEVEGQEQGLGVAERVRIGPLDEIEALYVPGGGARTSRAVRGAQHERPSWSRPFPRTR
jgi:hypothetical protein